jgi:hypothetical protein
VLEREINTESLPENLAPSVERTVKLCLEKDPRKRVADIRDVRLALACRSSSASRGYDVEIAAEPS